MMRMRPTLFSLASICSLSVVALGGSACKKETTGTDTHNALSNATETWCPDGFESGPSDTCFAVPEHGAKDTPVLVYLHGPYEGHGTPAEWEAVRVAKDRGFAVIIPRGKRGLCAWRTELKNHYCWPQDPEDTDAMKGVIAEWDKVLWQVDALLEPGTHKRYVLGFSNGGSFASFLATHTLFQGQAYAVVNGGPLGAPGKAKPVPMLLITAQDAAETAPKMTELHDTLAKATLPHAFCPRTGGAALTTDDVESAIRFFKRDMDGSLKAQANAYPCDAAVSRK